jgi:hypothetical protein
MVDMRSTLQTLDDDMGSETEKERIKPKKHSISQFHPDSA